MKKVSLLLVAAIGALIIPFSSASAAGGQWDYLGSSYASYNSTLHTFKTSVFKSGGGDFMIVADTVNVTYYLWEYDPGSGNDKLVGSAYLTIGEPSHTFRNIGKYVDGSNKKAEFYVTTALDTRVEFWD